MSEKKHLAIPLQYDKRLVTTIRTKSSLSKSSTSSSCAIYARSYHSPHYATSQYSFDCHQSLSPKALLVLHQWTQLSGSMFSANWA